MIMSQERIKILEMLTDGKITAAEADALLRAVDDGKSPPSDGAPHTSTRSARYLRIQVNDAGGATVNVSVPLQLIRSGIRLASLMPEHVQDRVNDALQSKGMDIDLRRATPEDIDALIASLSELTMEIDDGGDHVRIFCE
jgi:hypothetical protein